MATNVLTGGVVPAASAPFDLDYDCLFRASGLVPTYRGPWAYFGDTSRKSGWKLHISATHATFAALLAAAATRLAGRTAFKAIRSTHHLTALNEGLLGATQVGKAFTIYPGDDAEAISIAAEFEQFEDVGPRIITDLHVGGPVHARYGVFSPDVASDLFGQSMAFLEGGTVDRYSVPFAVSYFVSVHFLFSV
jgi:hypothetical protein